VLEKHRYKALLVTSIALYIIVYFGTGLFTKGSAEAKDFYFIGMTAVELLQGFIFLKVFNHPIVKTYLGFLLGRLFNEIFLVGTYGWFEIAVTGFLFIWFSFNHGEFKRGSGGAS